MKGAAARAYQSTGTPYAATFGYARDDGETFEARLRHDHPIERIAMQRRQSRRLVGVTSGDGDLQEAVGLERSEKIVAQHELARRRLDLGLPHTRGTEVDRRLAGFDHCACAIGQTAIRREPPQQRMGVRQDCRHRPTPKRSPISSSRSSKSAAISICPAQAAQTAPDDRWVVAHEFGHRDLAAPDHDVLTGVCALSPVGTDASSPRGS